MGSSLLLVKFPNGPVMFGRYQTASDVAGPLLWSDAADWKRNDRSGAMAAISDVEPVECWTEYGGGFGWCGTAVRDGADGVLVGGLSPFGVEGIAGPIEPRSEGYREEPWAWAAETLAAAGR